MQCPHCAHPDSIRYGTNRGVQRYRCPACRRFFQAIRRGKDPAFQQQACQLYLEGMGMRAIGRAWDPSQARLSQVGTSRPDTPRQPTTDPSPLLHRNR